jgi:phosphoglucomutase
MAIFPLAGKPAPKELLIDAAQLERECLEHLPELINPTQRVTFGTSGHRGSAHCPPKREILSVAS